MPILIAMNFFIHLPSHFGCFCILLSRRETSGFPKIVTTTRSRTRLAYPYPTHLHLLPRTSSRNNDVRTFHNITQYSACIEHILNLPVIEKKMGLLWYSQADKPHWQSTYGILVSNDETPLWSKAGDFRGINESYGQPWRKLRYLFLIGVCRVTLITLQSPWYICNLTCL